MARHDTKAKHAVPPGSTIAQAGSNFYGADAPFGSGTSRFSPSMSMAHHAQRRPQVAGGKANRKFVPPNLRTTQGDDGDGEGSVRATTPSTDQSSGAVATTPLSSFSSRSHRRHLDRPPSAIKDEQALGRQLRAEITKLREEKLAALRNGEPSPRGAGRPRTACGISSAPRANVVHLEALQQEGARLDELAGGRVKIRMPAPCPQHMDGTREVSMEYASLLEFVAGEARRR